MALKQDELAYSLGRYGRHPSPGEDAGLAENWFARERNIDGVYKFGFSTAFQFRDWFYSSELLSQLRGRGYHLAIYLVDTYFRGHSQMIADTRGKYTLVQKIDLATSVDEIESIAMGAIAMLKKQERETQKAAKKAERNAKRRARYAAKKALKLSLQADI